MNSDLVYIRNFAAKLIETDPRGFVRSRESSKVEFKETFNWANAEKYAKTMVAFANNQGGYIIFGIKDKPREIVGLPSNNFANLVPEKIAEYIRSSFSDALEFELGTFEVNEKQMGWIYTSQAPQKPLICTKNGGDLKDGAIYFRNGARTDVISSASLLRLIDERREKESERWFELFRSASKAGIENTALLDISSGIIKGPGGSVIIDENILKEVQFIKEGEFNEKTGSPTLRVIGEVSGTKTTIVERRIDPELKFTLIATEVGAELGFIRGGSATANATALIKYFGLQDANYMHTFKIGVNTHRKYSAEVVDILRQKAAQGEFEIDKNSESMKKIRKAAQKL